MIIVLTFPLLLKSPVTLSVLGFRSFIRASKMIFVDSSCEIERSLNEFRYNFKDFNSIIVLSGI